MRSRLRYWLGVLKEAWRRFIDDDHFVYAGHMSYTMLLSFGPFIVSAILLVQNFDPQATRHFVEMIESIEGRVIPAPMADVMKSVVTTVAPDKELMLRCGLPELQEVLDGAVNGGAGLLACSPDEVAQALTMLRQEPAAGNEVEGLFGLGSWVVVAITIMVGLYAASSAFEAARNGFNEAYDVKDLRGFFWKRFQSHLLAICIVSLFVVVSLIFVFTTLRFGSALQNFGLDPTKTMSDAYWELAGLGFAGLCGMGLFYCLLLGIHITLPRGYVKDWSLYVWARDETEDARAVCVPVRPGVRVSTVLWLLVAIGFSVVLGSLVSFDKNHGALAGVVATLLFFYLSAATIFFGAQINIAIATVDEKGEPKWPHPHVKRAPGFDETKLEAYQLMKSRGEGIRGVGHVVHVLRGGKSLGDCEGCEPLEETTATVEPMKVSVPTSEMEKA